jgi:hypothetical protein
MTKGFFMKISLKMLTATGACLVATLAAAHGVGEENAAFIATNEGPAIIPFLYLGAKHMVTGYDHLLFLVGVIFFLYKLKDVFAYASLFTLGHSLTFLVGVLGGVQANSYLVDAIIGLSVVYKAFDNMQGFQRFFGFQPNTRAAVMIFGLFHGFGLATKLQDLNPSTSGLVVNSISFNVGVELGQILALALIVTALRFWRPQPSFQRYAFFTNAALMLGGFLLVGYQLAGFFVA